MVQQVK